MKSHSLRLTHFIAILLVPLLVASCDALGDFGDVNENPTQPTELDPRFLFPSAQLETPGNWATMNRANHRFTSAAIQHMASTNEFWVGNTYDRLGGGGTEWSAQQLWGDIWDGPLVDIQHALAFLEDAKEEGEEVDPRIGQTRIWRALIYQLLTDAHGDVPFNEGAKGALEQSFEPSFDPQEEVYQELFTELDEAVNQLDGPGSGFGEQDLLVYEGDITKWKKFANSLRLRLAMRLVKVDEAWAQQEVEAAVSASEGVMEDNDDIAMYFHQGSPNRNHYNPNSYSLSEHEMGYPSQTFVNWLKERNDPRLTIYTAVVRDGEAIEVDDPDELKGMPNGYLTNRLPDHPSWTVNCRDDTGELVNDNGECSTDDYVQVHPQLLDREDPLFHLTYAQVAFNLAEANVRDWNVPGTAESHYEAGVRAAMKQLEHYGPGAVISDAAIDEYLNENPFKSGGSQEEQLEQINEQYWAATFMDGIEAWNNWRRSGYPELEPAPVDLEDAGGPGGGLPGNDTNGEVPRRMLYNDDEVELNTESLQEALDRQGPNEMMTRVWWDVEQ